MRGFIVTHPSLRSGWGTRVSVERRFAPLWERKVASLRLDCLELPHPGFARMRHPICSDISVVDLIELRLAPSVTFRMTRVCGHFLTRGQIVISDGFRCGLAGRALLAAAVVMLALGSSGCRGARQGASGSSVTGTETIVVLRHGEKAPGGLGQLSCKGLNRALALPKLLIERFGRANAVFAPNPSVEVREGALTRQEYSYVRPLATIEPTAIELGLPVNTQIGFPDIAGLEAAVTAPPIRTARCLSRGSTSMRMTLRGRCCGRMGWTVRGCRPGRGMTSRRCMSFGLRGRRVRHRPR